MNRFANLTPHKRAIMILERIEANAWRAPNQSTKDATRYYYSSKDADTRAKVWATVSLDGEVKWNAKGAGSKALLNEAKAKYEAEAPHWN